MGREVDSVRILWWNVENAFDTVDDPLTYDEEFTPGGTKAWSSYRFYRKVTALAKGLRAASRGRCVLILLGFAKWNRRRSWMP